MECAPAAFPFRNRNSKIKKRTLLRSEVLQGHHPPAPGLPPASFTSLASVENSPDKGNVHTVQLHFGLSTSLNCLTALRKQPFHFHPTRTPFYPNNERFLHSRSPQYKPDRF